MKVMEQIKIVCLLVTYSSSSSDELVSPSTFDRKV